MEITQLETDRLLLRQWQDTDLSAFAALNADAEVMMYFPDTLSKEESDATAEKCRMLIEKRGWGFWAVEQKETGQFIGFVGLHEPSAQLPFYPCVEIGWRLSKKYWGNGYATEAANQALRYAFKTLVLNEVVSFTTVSNHRSRAVMERLGLVNANQNFHHPNIPDSHLLSEHVLYKITCSQWLAKESKYM